VHEIVLAPLRLDDVGRLIADALHCEPEPARPLAELVQEKTGGNPFFAIQFFIALADEGLLAFDPAASAWQWNIDHIRAKSYTDNVVDLMAGKLKRFSAGAQDALKQFACLGNVVPIATLALVHETTEETVHAALGEAVHVGLVFREDGAYKFLHDRIQQAAYSLIADDDRAEVHLRIGRVLLANIAPEQLGEHLFDIANQLNRGAALLVDREEKTRIATINLQAARKAKASAAYASAGVYLAAGIALLDETYWASQYELMFTLRLESAECEFLRGNLDEVEGLIAALLQHGTSKVDLAAAYHLKVLLHVVKSENPQAVASALTCLRLFGIDLPAHPSWEQVQDEYEAVWRNLDGRGIEDLIDLPQMTDPELLAAMRLLSVLCDPAYVTDQNLLCLELCRAVNLGIRHGVSGAFAHACCYLAWPLATVFRRYPEGYRFAKLGYDLVEKHAFLIYLPKVQDATGIAAFWTQPMATSIDFVRASFRTALETGDLTYGCYAMYHTVTLLLLRNEPLDAVAREAEIARDFVRDAKFRDMEDTIVPQQRFIAMMQGRTASIYTFNDDQFDEAVFEAQLMGGRMPTMICWYWTMKAKARFLAGDHAEALAAIDKATVLLWSSTGHFPLIDYYYYAALTVAALYQNASAAEQPRWDQLLQLRDQLREWAEVNRPSFGDKHALVAAEIARLEGRELEAMHLYEEAIALARENDFVQNEALAHELAAQFYKGRGFETVANAYLRNARGCYLRWGADGKVKQLDRLHPQLAAAASNRVAATIGSPVQQLDVATVVKASQAVSSEIVLPRLIERLMTIVLENAGADRGLLILPTEDDHLIQAEAETAGDRVAIVRSPKAISATSCPESLVRYVIRTHESVILDDASRPNLFSKDDYLRGGHAKSILCLPLIQQGRLTGLLYLENTLTAHAFTPDRIAILDLLAAQAAVSLENARLYNDLQQREAKVRRLVDSNIIGIFIWDVEGRVLEANEAILRMVGHTRDDVVSGRVSWTELTPPEWRGADAQALADVLATGVCKSYEKEYFRKDGSRVPIHVGAAMLDEARHQGVAFVLDLTERKQTEQALRHSEAYLSEAQRLSHTGSWAWVPARNEIRYWSEECFRILGFDLAKAPPPLEAIFQRIHPDDRTKAADVMVRASSDRSDFMLDYRVIHDDGRVRDLHLVGHPVFSGSGDLTEFVGTLIDVTERRQAEEQHQAHIWFLESMDRINRAIQGTNDLEQMTRDVLAVVLSIFACDRAWLIYPCDPEAPSWRAVMEHTRPEYPGAFALGIDLPVDAEIVNVFQTARASGGAVQFGPQSIHPVPSQIAERFGIQSVIAITINPKVDRPYLFGLHQCSHPRTWTAQEERLFQEIGRRLGDGLTGLLMLRNLQESEGKLEEAQRIAHVGYWDHDLDNDSFIWSDETYRICGIPLGEKGATTAVLKALVHPDDWASHMRASIRTTRGEAPFNVECRVIWRNGEVRFIHSRGNVTIDETGRARRMFGIIQDMTERKQSEENLRESERRNREAQAELEHVSRLSVLGELTASIAHEVNQPLTGVVTYGDACLRWLDRKSPQLEQARSAVEQMIGSARHASDVIARIRVLSKKGALESVRLDINQVILDVVALIRREMDAHAISLRLELGSPLASVIGDRIQLQQVMMNLLMNGIQAMGEVTGRRRELLIRSREDDSGQVIVAVEDSGTGIEPEHIERLFNAFFTTKPDGVGMGLSICRSIIEQHGGRIWANRNSGSGSTFQFTLTASPEAAS
jgi:PAS domain S-box-containing protein